MTTNEKSTWSAHKLRGKVNYFDWRRYFDRATKLKDLWKLLTGEEKLLPEPKAENYLVYVKDTKDVVDSGLSYLNWQ